MKKVVNCSMGKRRKEINAAIEGGLIGAALGALITGKSKGALASLLLGIL